MKKYLIIGLVFLMGCASVSCPKEDIILHGIHPRLGPMPLLLEKGSCDNPENYTTLKEFERQQREKRMH